MSDTAFLLLAKEADLPSLVIGKAQESLSYNCVGYCCSCNNPVYIDPTGDGYQTIQYTENSIYLHNKIRDILGDKQKSNKHQCSIPITLSIPDNEFVKK